MKQASFFRTPDSSGRIYLHWTVFPCFLIYLDLLLPLFTGVQNKAVFTTILIDVAMGLIISALTCIFPGGANRIITMVLIWVISFYFVLESVLHGQFAMYVDISTVLQGTGNVVGEYGNMVIKATIGAIPRMVICALPGIFYTIFGKKLLPAARPSFGWVIALAEAALLVFVISLFIISNGPGRNVYSRAYKFDSAVQVFGLPAATRLEVEYEIFGNNSANSFRHNASEEILYEDHQEAGDRSEKNEMQIDFAAVSANADESAASMNEYVSVRRASDKNDHTGIFAGKNLILICAEAFSGAVTDPELTPTLYRLTHNGFYFSDYYQPFWGGSTSTGEYSFLTGLAPQFNLDTIQRSIGENNYFTLGNQLQREGYFSLAFHNGKYDYFNRNLTHPNMGYSQFIAYGSGMEDLLPEGAGDAEMFEKTMDMYMDKAPFSIYYMTISGHYPYTEDSPYSAKYYDRVNEVLGDRYEETTKYFFCYQMELEEALTIMVERLEETGMADDTVICLSADHYPYGLGLSDSFGSTFGNETDFIRDLYRGDDKLLWDRDRNALIIWSGCLENEYKSLAVEISEPTSSLDVVPTLSNLFGLEFDSRMLAGRDVFSGQPPLVFWNEGSWITSKGRYDIVTDTFYPAPGQGREDDYISTVNGIVADRKFFSGQVLAMDYYDILFETP